MPAFSQHVIEINKKLSSLQTINFSSAGELANVILKDISLTNRLLKVVNSAFYGNLSGRVTTISRAVFLLGFEKVRMAAASLMIFDHLQNKSQASDLKDAALSSFFSAVIAKDVSENLMFGNTEEVFICALIHNVGKHLVICYFPEEYNEIKNMMAVKEIDEQSASREVLGISYSELGMGITKTWNFPEKIIESMDIIRDKQAKASETEADVLRNIANYANELCSITAETDEMKREEALQELSEKYKLSVSLPANRTMSLVEGAAGKIDRYMDMIKIDKANSPLMRRLISYREEKAAPGKTSPLRIMNKAGEEGGYVPEAATVDPHLEMIKNCLLEINEALQAESSLGDTIYMILETMYRGFEFNRVLFCMMNQSRTKMAARFGFGENVDELIGQFEFRIVRSSDIFSVAVMRMRDFQIDDLTAPGARANLPDWYLKNISAVSLLLYPLIVKDKCIGLFYADKKVRGILNEDEFDYMNILRNKAVWAILHKH
ncbi:MAG TPA: HDOD domain-containing protein [Smithellaceae bacterium]|nr:HDOD domain-containing protein [Smithellaceae bacterium]